jgi:hypothetical protein
MRRRDVSDVVGSATRIMVGTSGANAVGSRMEVGQARTTLLHARGATDGIPAHKDACIVHSTRYNHPPMILMRVVQLSRPVRLHGMGAASHHHPSHPHSG